MKLVKIADHSKCGLFIIEMGRQILNRLKYCHKK